MSGYAMPAEVAGNSAGDSKKVAGLNGAAKPKRLIQADNWSIPSELIRRWRWRCLDEDILVAGSDLCVANSESGRLVPMAQRNGNPVERHDLRHGCGGHVIPVVPLKAT